MKLLRKHPLVLALVLLATAAFALQAARTVIRERTQAAHTGSLAALAPSGALLSIESPDFAALLKSWNSSPEQKSWLASDNYSVFSNSRLFGRLSDAEGEFAQASQIPAATLLPQVAGRESLFAWYDVGHLQFLYITRMPPAQAARTDLLKSRGKWKTREAGGHPFYLRTAPSTDPANPRTVAFATAGDLLFLATREDLLAHALELLGQAGRNSTGVQPDALAGELWFQESNAALKPDSDPPMLHMVLNLDRIVPMPYFRSYWVQQNITEMKAYRAAVSDLYRDNAGFREERAILLKSPDDLRSADLDLAPLAALVPSTGVFRVRATADPAVAVSAIEEKLLGRAAAKVSRAEDAPDASLAAPEAGTASDLEVRIDAPPPVSAASSDQGLSTALTAAGQDALLTWSSAAQAGGNKPAGALWLPIHSAVVLRATHAWSPDAIAAALQQSLRGSLTASNLGIDFHPASPFAAASGVTVYTLTGPKLLVFAVSGPYLVLADDVSTLGIFLRPAHPEAATPATQNPATQDLATQNLATRIVGFNHTAERAPYARLTSLIDGTNTASDAHATPAFFSQNVRSLSDSFAALESERFLERHQVQGGETMLRQTVTYQWHER